jgi:lipoate-protein ligase A
VQAVAAPWRLIQHHKETGPFNMGLDEAALRTASEHGIATLRLYTWAGPWLSLGYAQRQLAGERRTACERAGIGIVRRTTGGRAVLHGRDLTYSLAAPEGMLRPGLRNSYDQVATALLRAIRSLGAEQARRVPALRGAAPSKNFDCFAEPAGDEIVVQTEKLVGSAQRRRGGAVLQHGSIRVAADPAALAVAAGVDPAASVSLTELGVEASEKALREALVTCFSQVLGVEFSPAEPELRELEQARARADLHREDCLAAPSSKTV